MAADGAFTFHHLEHVLGVLAATAGSDGVTLVTPPGGATYGGPEFYRRMVDAGRARHGDVRVRAVIDCGEDASAAMQALRGGWEEIVLSGSAAVHEKVGQMSAKAGTVLRRERPATIDLAWTADASAVLRALSDTGGIEHGEERDDEER